MRKLCVSLGLLAVIVILSQTSAQQPDPALFKLMRPVMRVVGESPGTLAMNPGVQKEIKMDEDQVKAVQEKVAPMAIGFGRGGGRGKGKGKGEVSPEAKERFTKMFEKLETLKDVPEDKLEAKIRETFKDEINGPTKEVEKILKPEQMARLKQIARQQGGPEAYLKPENAKDLELTAEQKTKIKDIDSELQKDLAELRMSGGMGFRVSPETREKMTAVTKEATEKATAVLTDKQKSKWKELTGEPYTVQFGGGPRRKKDD